MAEIKTKIESARKAGYSESEIRRFLMAHPATEKARSAGYSDAEIAQHLGLEAEPETAPHSYLEDVGSYLGETVGNIPSSLLDFTQGVYETAAHPVDTATALGSAVMHPLDTAQNVAGYAAKRYGSPSAALETFKTDPIGVLADVSTALGGAAGAAKGMGLGVAPALRSAAAATSPANAFLPLIQAPAVVGSYGYELARNALAPRYATYLEATEGRAPEIINALRNPANELVPGSMPTAAQAAVPAGSTRFSQLGASAAEVLPTAYMERAQQQAAARRALMGDVAKTEADLQAARTAREAAAKQEYGAAYAQAPVEESRALSTLLDRPSMDKALSRAAELAAERNETFQLGKTAPAQQVGTGLFDAAGNEIMRTVPATKAKFPIRSLHFLKLAMDDLIRNPERFGIGATEAAAIKNTRTEFLNFVKQSSSLYERARAGFAARSGPINRMEIGQYLLTKLLSPLDEAAPQRAGVFATAVQQAPQTIQRALEGAPRYEKLSDVLNPDEVRKVEAIRADLAREAQANRLARAAAEAGPEAGRAVEIPRANLMNRVFNVVNRIITGLERKIDKRLAIQIATEMLDPTQTAQVIEEAMAYADKSKKGAERIRAAGKTAAQKVRGVSPEISAIITFQNAMSPDNRNAMAR